ncbi:hypothetical protein OAG73_02155, partial [bacterium]|nr:hypothetical protein [bacterium]
EIKKIDKIPLRLDLVGFYDQLFLNEVLPGSVVLVNINTIPVDDRSGMSSSTRSVIRKVFGNNLPPQLTPEETAKTIFAVENPPGHKYISGVVDQLGICLPGINKLKFDNSYWPYNVNTIADPEICNWLQSILYLKQTKPRPLDYDVFQGNENYLKSVVQKQSELGEECWSAIQSMDTKKLGLIINEVHETQKKMIPGYESLYVKNEINVIRKKHLGVKLMGAGGFGYMMIVTNKPDKDFQNVSIRREHKE